MRSGEVYAMILIVQDEQNKRGSFFSATNYKKNGQLRKWSCRLGVTKHLRGGPAAYNAEDKNFITVWDPNAKTKDKYRQLNISTLQELTVCGVVLVKDGYPTDEYRKREATAATMLRLRKA